MKKCYRSLIAVVPLTLAPLSFSHLAWISPHIYEANSHNTVYC